MICIGHTEMLDLEKYGKVLEKVWKFIFKIV